PDAIENARPGSFADAFFFSVQTMATIGYGRMVPRTFLANTLVTLETLTGLLALAMITGLVFAKFSRPTARVLFSRVAVIGGLDESYAQTVHARHSYGVQDIAWDARFVDIVTRDANGALRIDYGQFHDVVPLESVATSVRPSWAS